MAEKVKSTMAVLQASSLRNLIDTVNQYNDEGENKILREDIVEIQQRDGTFFLIYFK